MAAVRPARLLQVPAAVNISAMVEIVAVRVATEVAGMTEEVAGMTEEKAVAALEEEHWHYLNASATHA